MLPSCIYRHENISQKKKEEKKPKGIKRKNRKMGSFLAFFVLRYYKWIMKF